jgi:hypothetical protein
VDTGFTSSSSPGSRKTATLVSRGAAVLYDTLWASIGVVRVLLASAQRGRAQGRRGRRAQKGQRRRAAEGGQSDGVGVLIGVTTRWITDVLDVLPILYANIRIAEVRITNIGLHDTRVRIPTKIGLRIAGTFVRFRQRRDTLIGAGIGRRDITNVPITGAIRANIRISLTG